MSLALVAPSGATVQLQGRTLGRQTELRQTYSLRTTPVLVALLGESAQGGWALRVVDHAPGATGRLLEWGLALGLG